MKLSQTSKKPVFIYGPPGCGKTTNAKRLAEFFNCDTVIDNWTPDKDAPNGALILTTSYVKDGMEFWEAMTKMYMGNL